MEPYHTVRVTEAANGEINCAEIINNLTLLLGTKRGLIKITTK